jgi:hypothetical protein
MPHTATKFSHLDTQIQLAAPHMPDGPFDRLVSRWADEAVRFVTAEPITPFDGHALAAKLRVFARLVEETDGSVFAEREQAMARAIVEDVERVDDGVPA